jgi:N-acetylglucosamine-6-sulfatase
MRKTVLLLASAALAILFFSAIPGSISTALQGSSAKPNFVFIIADDMRKDDLKYMPKTRALLGAQGMRFQKAFVSSSLCCPSRATIMRGQYAHNTEVWSNEQGPEGGWEGYQSNGNEQDNVATRLNNAGYSTALLGKYFNGYREAAPYVPPGWDRWFATLSFKYFDYDVNDGGAIRHFGTSDKDYLTDMLKRQTKAFISTSVAHGKPFFAYVAPLAPHSPVTPAPRHLHAYDGEKVVRPPHFNEQDVSDKPPDIRSRPLLTPEQIAAINRRYERRAETLQALDELVAGVVHRLKTEGVMDNTYVFFTSDNGWVRGEHRRANGKGYPYEEDIHVPLLVRGPGVAAGSTTQKLALNTDYLPTFMDFAGVQTPDYVDGRSLRPVLEGSAPRWRSAILLEAHQGPGKYAATAYYGIRTKTGEKYLEYEGGFRELYDLNTDPYELTNSYDENSPPLTLATRLRMLKSCSGDGCRTAENGP